MAFFDTRAAFPTGPGRGQRDTRVSARPFFIGRGRGVVAESIRGQRGVDSLGSFLQAQLAESLRSRFGNLVEAFGCLWVATYLLQVGARSRFRVSAESIRHGLF